MLKGFPQQENRLRDSFPDTAKYKKDFCLDAQLRAERRAGEMLRDDPEFGPGKHSKLEGLGIEAHQSHRWQLEAKVSEEMFEKWLTEILQIREWHRI